MNLNKKVKTATGIDVYKWWVGIDLNQLTLIDIV